LSANESSTGEEVPFGTMLGELGSAIIIIPLIGILESVAIAKAFGKLLATKTISVFISKVITATI